MPIAWFYAFADSGYDRGVKVGRSSSSHGAWDDAPSYSPRPMIYRAGWRVDLPESPNVTKGKSASIIERRLHTALGRTLTFPRNGREWFDLTPDEAVERIAAALGMKPYLENGHLNQQVTNDQFRNPHPRRLDRHTFKVVAWLYREHETGRLKTQVIDDWAAPFEVRRRYSRNGFDEIAAFSYMGPPSVDGNHHVHTAWCGMMSLFGPGTDDTFYGWLNADTPIEAVRAAYKDTGLREIEPDRSKLPEGVRPAYNRAVGP